MPKNKNSHKIFNVKIVAPKDAENYCKAAVEVIDAFNQHNPRCSEVTIKRWWWHEDAFPQAGGDIQSKIDNQMDIESGDFVVGIFRSYIGKGTAHEIAKALRLQGQKNNPIIGLYFIQHNIIRSKTALLQEIELENFKERYEELIFIPDVRNRPSFKEKFRNDLEKIIEEYLHPSTEIIDDIRPPQSNVTELLKSSCPPPNDFAIALRDSELEQAKNEGTSPFWTLHPGEAFWMGSLFAFWTKIPGIPADNLKFSISGDTVTRAYYKNIPDSFEFPPDTRGRQKVRFDSFGSGLLSDETAELKVSPINFGLKRYVENYWNDFFKNNPKCSAFGVLAFEPVPSITVAHGFVLTSDGWLLMARRSKTRDYFHSVWSVSYEEQTDVGPSVSDSSPGDRNIEDTIVRGLREEFGISQEQVKAVEVLSIGRECVLDPKGLVINLAVVCAVFVRLNLTEVWALLADPTANIDQSENDAWAGLHVENPDSLFELISITTSGQDMSLAGAANAIQGVLDVCPVSLPEAKDGLLRWHPTSPARLALCGALQIRSGTNTK